MPVSLSPTATLPTDPPAPRSVEWEFASIVGVNKSPYSAQAQMYDWGQDVLRASLSYQPMLDAQARAWVAFLAACHGQLGTFLFGDPLHRTPTSGGASGGAVTGASQAGRTLVTSSSGLLPGDWIQIGVRMYLVTSEASGTLGIFPAIRESPANGASITVSNCRGLFRLSKNVQKISLNTMKEYGLSFEIEEAL